MKRRRHALQVSTFPFLAVLLCAMGSLILLLLVMDRRAKAVARAKLLQTVAASAAADSEAAAEWQRRRQALHDSLVDQDQEVQNQLQAIVRRSARTASDLQAAEVRGRSLQEQLQTGLTVLARSREEEASRKAEASHAAAKSAAAQQQLAQLSGELVQLEQTLAELKSLRQQQQQRYSFVPYKGRQGDNRRPLYVECSRDGVVFFPDRQLLPGPNLLPQDVRFEVERRITARQQSGSPAADKGSETPYLFLLVRPDGIVSYYVVLRAIEELHVDSGYEFVEADWMLDFPEDADAPRQPWMAQESPRPPRHEGLTQLTGPRPRGVVPPGEPQRVGGSDAPDVGTSGSAGEPRDVQVPHFTDRVSSHSGLGSALPDAPVGPAGPVSGYRPALGIPFPYSPSPGSNDSGLALPAFGQRGLPGGQSDLAPRLTESSKPRESGGSGAGSSAGNSEAASGTADIRYVPAMTTGGGSPIGSGTTGAGPAGPVPDAGKPAASVSAADPASGSSGAARPTSTPSGSAADATHAGGSGQPTSDSGMPQSPAPAGNGAAGGDVPSALRPPDVLPGEYRKTERPPPRPAQRLGNRDWYIFVECKADALVLSPSGLRFSPDSLVGQARDKNPLLTAVHQLIERRQATVRPGDPPYRPLIRFQVRPEGLRAYYLAYPALEALQVPMGRENILPEDESKNVRPLR
jgi:hypothetical protein